MMRAMIRTTRPFAFLALALMLALTGQLHAVARAGGANGGSVICTGRGALTVVLDADGKPTGAVKLCPDCICHALAAVLPQSGDWRRPLTAARLAVAPARDPRAARPLPEPQARDPPAAA